MGQKTDKIRDLETELAAERYLLRKIGDSMGIEFEPPTTTAEATHEHQRFTQALLALGIQAARSRGSVVEGATEATTKPRRPRPVAPGSWDTHDEEVDAQIDRLEAQGLTQPREAGGALVRRDVSDAYSSLPADFAPAELAPTILAIANELGLNVNGSRDDEALTAIHEEILRIKNAGGDIEAAAGAKFLSKGDSLGDAVRHGHAQAEELRDAATQSRTIVNRLAAVMQIGQWDKDGTELLERAQKWEMWKYELQKRIRELRAVRPSTTMSLDESDVAQRISEELQRQLDRLLSPKELIAWLKALEKAGAPVKVDAGPPVPPYPFEVRPGDAGLIMFALDVGDVKVESERIDPLWKMFSDISNSRTSADEFARTMNLVILPILARQRAAQKVPEDASQPAAE